MTKIWSLPRVLDRKYTFKEKLEVWLFGDCFKDDQGIWRIRPYALYRKFVNGQTSENPYLRHRFRREPEYLFNEELHYTSEAVKRDSKMVVEAVTHLRDALNNVQTLMKTVQKDQRALRGDKPLKVKETPEA